MKLIIDKTKQDAIAQIGCNLTQIEIKSIVAKTINIRDVDGYTKHDSEEFADTVVQLAEAIEKNGGNDVDMLIAFGELRLILFFFANSAFVDHPGDSSFQRLGTQLLESYTALNV